MAIERGTHDQARLKQRERILNGKVEDILTRKESLSKELLEIDIKPQRQTEQRELTEHMLDALQQQNACIEQQMQEQQQLINHLDTQIQLEYADGTERRSTMQTEIKEAIKTLHDAKEELMHFKTALEKAKMDYKKGTAQRDAAAALLPPFVARKGEMATERRMLLKEAEERAKQAAALRAENENLDSYIKGDVC
ncbi:hypothetical protein, conserved [Eimeria maxima]|uniref:Uncharacterized protein n=1 Tax=Eimeria maxima TaxID=5804 RepID=U6M1C0_EIMMA|nr:hypothetical protein, conserved [Eimeria maxima]CDJ57801.1 hypothetical protein, conserved [Eimeria maxima]